MKNGKKLMLCAVIFSIFGATICSAVNTRLTFGEISVSPLSPAAQSTITISIPVGGDTPSEVRVKVEECNGRTGICYPKIQNVSMSLASGGNYQAKVTLIHADATYINCTIAAKMNGTWMPSARWKVVNLSENSNGNSSNGDKKTPGFDVVLIIIAIGVSLIMIRRKREK
ncbi:Uncharacterised protein [uncultured archaeon]|nr:Uncharacterised protein [uncultured archaeon]